MQAPTSRPIDNLRTEWDTIRRSSASRRALARLAEAEPMIGALNLADLGELVDLIGAATTIAERDEAAVVFSVLLRFGDVHPLLARAALQALLPGLVSLAKRLGWGRGGDWEDPGTFFTDVAALAWEVFVGWTGQDRPYAVLDVLSAVRCRVRRQIIEARIRRSQEEAIDDPDRFATPQIGGSNHLEVLARAIDDAPLDRFDAGVLYGTCVLGYSITDLHRLTGATRRRIGGRQRDAARELLA